jgi:single-strand DNA-binding protein
MKGLNQVTLMGRLTKDPEYKEIGESNKASFTVAIPSHKNKEGVEVTDFINCVAWNNTVEIIKKYASKGQLVLIEGKIQVRDYEKDGKRNWITEIITNKFTIVSNKKTEETK